VINSFEIPYKKAIYGQISAKSVIICNHFVIRET